LDGKIISVVISTSEVPERDKKILQEEFEVKGFLIKPIKEEDINRILDIYYSEKKN
jgi:AmiR/NasT family two-component response regulator